MKSFNSLKRLSALWNKVAAAVVCLFALVLISGCASTKITDRDQLVTGPIPRPGTIWVYDFVATPADVPANSALNGEKLDTTPQTAEQIAEGRKLGAQIATELIAEIRAMGMTAELATVTTIPNINDISIQGYLLSFNEGNAAERVAIGFGTGKSSLTTMVEGFQMTAQGERKLGYGDIKAGGSDSPGAALGVVTLIATANPAGLIVSSGMKVYGEESGSSEVTGRAKATAKEIGVVLKRRFTNQGWLN